MCSFEFLDPFYLLFVIFFLFQTCWTFPPALDLSPGVGTAQKDERKGSNRRGMEEGRGVEREGGGAAIEMEKKIPSSQLRLQTMGIFAVPTPPHFPLGLRPLSLSTTLAFISTADISLFISIFY